MRCEWELEDLIECWTLDEAELGLLANKSGATRLGFALMLKFFEQEARFPRREDVPRAAWSLWLGRSRWTRVCSGSRRAGQTALVACLPQFAPALVVTADTRPLARPPPAAIQDDGRFLPYSGPTRS